MIQLCLLIAIAMSLNLTAQAALAAPPGMKNGLGRSIRTPASASPSVIPKTGVLGIRYRMGSA